MGRHAVSMVTGYFPNSFLGRLRASTVVASVLRICLCSHTQLNCHLVSISYTLSLIMEYCISYLIASSQKINSYLCCQLVFLSARLKSFVIIGICECIYTFINNSWMISQNKGSLTNLVFMTLKEHDFF